MRRPHFVQVLDVEVWPRLPSSYCLRLCVCVFHALPPARAQVILYGHGAFTIENVRTLLEHRCKKVFVMCRKRNLCGMKASSGAACAIGGSAAKSVDRVESKDAPLCRFFQNRHWFLHIPWGSQLGFGVRAARRLFTPKTCGGQHEGVRAVLDAWHEL